MGRKTSPNASSTDAPTKEAFRHTLPLLCYHSKPRLPPSAHKRFTLEEKGGSRVWCSLSGSLFIVHVHGSQREQGHLYLLAPQPPVTKANTYSGVLVSSRRARYWGKRKPVPHIRTLTPCPGQSTYSISREMWAKGVSQRSPPRFSARKMRTCCFFLLYTSLALANHV